jgi:hypothetical protein
MYYKFQLLVEWEGRKHKKRRMYYKFQLLVEWEHKEHKKRQTKIKHSVKIGLFD